MLNGSIFLYKFLDIFFDTSKCEIFIYKFYLILFTFFKLLVVLPLVFIFIRYPANHFILSIQGLSPMLIIVLLIFYNLGLIYINFKLFKYIEHNLFPYFLEIYITIPVIEKWDWIFYNMYPISFEEYGKLDTLKSHFNKYGLISRQKCKEAQHTANILNNIAPIMDRSGKGGLHDSFIDSAKRFQCESDKQASDVEFFTQQARYLAHFLENGTVG